MSTYYTDTNLFFPWWEEETKMRQKPKFCKAEWWDRMGSKQKKPNKWEHWWRDENNKTEEQEEGDWRKNQIGNVVKFLFSLSWDYDGILFTVLYG